MSVTTMAMSALSVALSLARCKQENREFREMPPAATPTEAIRVGELQPGGGPPFDSTVTKYADNAYAIGVGQPLASSVRGRGSGSSSRVGSARLGRLFVIAQVALTLVLVIVTSLFVRTLLKLRAEPLGVDRTHLLLVWTAPGQAGRSGERLPEFIHTLLDSVSRVPGVNTATGTNHGLLEGEDGGGASELLDVSGLSPKGGLMVMRDAVSPGFFETAGMPLIDGRDLSERDVNGAPRVAVINETMSRFFFGSQARSVAGSGAGTRRSRSSAS